ncbi:hypothetical protein [Actinopolyspora mortivallis]|uniref:Uncharacterized protein n=1 Tax=Actinopolyspora mortivallis TaxID=33906 RepID=A0A2T0H0E6_ACTMO|nr:hypothetical protein [Actinopolyspora mortivallis]PRW64838.1 hypothetical protein CEP50_03200 [Actinopolyspora mortivallis]
MRPSVQEPRQHGPGTRSPSETDRHLVAAVHLKPELADRIIANYLHTPHEALPPPQGVDAVRVLTQALVARRRRHLRDFLVLGLLALAGVFSLPYSLFFLVAWATVWLFWSLTFGRNTAGATRSGPRTDEEEINTVGLVTTVAFFVGWFPYAVLYVRTQNWFASLASGGYSPEEPRGESTSAWSYLPLVPVLLFLLTFAVILVVLLLDKWVTRYLIASVGAAVAAPSRLLVSTVATMLTTAVTRHHVDLLNAVARRSDGNTVLPHVGWHAFPGYGRRLNAWTFPLVLRAKDRDTEPPALRPKELYSAVTEELHSMLDSDRLVPGRRLRELTVNPVVVVNTTQLHRNRFSPVARALLPEGNEPGVSSVDTETMDLLIDENTEWARHFQQSSVPSWDTELSVTTLFNIGCDNRTLYLEWNAYCLFPISPDYRLHGSVASTFGDAFPAALLELLQLLGSIAWRWRTLGGLLPRERLRPVHGEVRSIRETAAGEECANEFQDLDGQRHITLLEERTLSAVRNHLSERGFHTEDLEQHTTQVINNTSNSFHNAQFLGAQNFGDQGTAQAAVLPRPPGRTTRE